MIYLLDVNPLLALTDSLSLHHAIAHHWFAQGTVFLETVPLK